MLGRLQKDPRSISVDVIETELVTLARKPPIVLTEQSSVVAAGVGFKAHNENVNQKYARNRGLRRAAIDRLASQISELAETFGLTFTSPLPDETLESSRDLTGSGLFQSRVIDCRHPQAESALWRVQFDENKNFRKPFPYGGNTLAVGKWSVRGVRNTAGKIHLNLTDEGTTEFVVNKTEDSDTPLRADPRKDDPMSLLDQSWFLRCISDLTGTKIDNPS